jgi:rhodanese-related sulfurtransferase
MALQSISANDAKRLIERGALVVDIREPDEYAREHIPHAISRPVSGLTQGTLDIDQASQIIFHCKSGGRTRSNAARLASAASCEAFMLEGGLDAWKRAGLPVEVDRTQPLEVMRQVQIAAGSLVLLGIVLGALLSPWFYALSGFVGGGLIFAGATGFCGLARLLQVMPWNRRMSM